MLHHLLQVGSRRTLLGHPKLGASWEGFAIEQILATLSTRDAYFWATHGGAELDLLVMVKGQRHGFEVKYADAPGRTRSMTAALSDLGLAHLWLIYPGNRRYELGERITAIPLADVASLGLT